MHRVVALLPILLGVSAISFLIIHLLPADPAVAYLGEHATPEAIVRVRHEFGLDQPLPVQYGVYLWNVVRGDFGDSLDSHRPVLVEFTPRFPATVELALGAITIALLVGIPVGLMSASRPNSILDRLGMALALTGVSLPVFWLGLMLVYIFSVYFHVLPTSGQIGIDFSLVPITHIDILDALLAGNWSAARDAVRHLILPSITLSTYSMAIIARMTRASMLDALHQDYIRTARAKGLAAWVVVVVHGLRNALLPVVTVIGSAGRRALLGGHPHRNDLLLARRRPVHVRLDPLPRLPRDPRGHPPVLAGLHARQPVRGRPVCFPRPPNPLRVAPGRRPRSAPRAGRQCAWPCGAFGATRTREPGS